MTISTAINRSSGSGSPKARTGVTTTTTVGTVFTITRLLGSSSTLSLIAGTNANLSLSGANVQAAVALGTATQTAVVREALGQLAIEYPIAITGAVPIIPISISGAPSAGTAGSAFTFTPATANGSGTKTFSVVGTLPSWATLDPTTGSVTGTNPTAGTSSFSIRVSDASGAAVLVVSITIAAVTGTSANARSATLLTRTSGPIAYPPTVSFNRPIDWVDGDQGVLQWSTDASFATGVVEGNIITLNSATNSYDLGLSAITSGSVFLRFAAWTGARPTSLNWSNIVNVGDVVAPTITSSATPSGYQYKPGSMILTANELANWAIIPGGDSGSFSLSGNTLSWTALSTLINRTIQISATDYAGNVSTQTITLGNAANQPTAFAFTPAAGAALSSANSSNTITVQGGQAGTIWPYAFTGTGTLYIKAGGVGSWVAAGTSGFTSANDQFYVAETAAANNSTSVSGTLTIGTTASTFSVATIPSANMTYQALTTPAAIGSVNGSVTFPACDLGPAAPNRAILYYVGGYAQGNPITAMTINGVVATMLANPGGQVGSLWIANVPNGTTGDVVLTANGNAWNGASITGYALYGANIVPTGLSLSTDNGFSTFAPMTTPAGGATFVFISNGGATGSTFSAGITVDGTSSFPAFNSSITRGHTGTAGEVDISTTNNYYNTNTGVAVSFGR